MRKRQVFLHLQKHKNLLYKKIDRTPPPPDINYFTNLLKKYCKPIIDSIERDPENYLLSRIQREEWSGGTIEMPKLSVFNL